MGLTVVPGPADILTAKYTVQATFPAVQTMTYITGSVAAADHTGGSTTTVSMPAGTASGDLLLLYVYKDGGTFQTPTGWTAVETGGFGALYSKVAAAGEPPLAYTFAAAPGDRALMVRGYRGVSTTPTVAKASMLETANVGTVTAPQVSYQGGGTIVYGWGGFESFVASQINPNDAAVVHRLGIGEVVVTSTTGDETVTNAGTSTPRSASGLGGTCNWTVFTVLLT